MATALTEDQVMETITKAIGSEPSRRDKAARFIEWGLKNGSVLRAEFVVDVVLLRKSPRSSMKVGRLTNDGRFIIKLHDDPVEEQITTAVKALMRGCLIETVLANNHADLPSRR